MKIKAIIFTLILINFSSFSQERSKSISSSFDVNYSYGVIANHNSDILHLITGHPESVLISWNKKTFGLKKWEQTFNYPDIGVSVLYQDLKNKYLGKNYSLY